IRPWLAESWTQSADGRTYTFKLRQGVTFHDGSPFNADAAVKNFQHFSQQATSRTAHDIAPNLVRASAPDPSTLVWELKLPAAGFLPSLEAVPMVSPLALDQWGDDYGQHPVGTGPFKLKEWVPQDHLTLERNPDYAWPPAGSTNPGAAYLDSITFRF